jgi:hypothetical protein
VEEVYPDKHTGLYNLIDSFHIATAIISSTTSILPISNNTFESSDLNLTMETINNPIADNIYQPEHVTEMHTIPKISLRLPFEWFYKHLTRFGIRGLIIAAIISICFLLCLLLLIIHLHCKNRHSKKTLSQSYKQTNGKNYSQIKRYSIVPPDGHQSKKRIPKFLRYLHTNQSKPSSFRLTSNGSISRLNSSDSYHLISSIQENHKDKKALAYKNSDCVLTEHCCVHSAVSQPIPSSSSIYHQVNRLMLSGSEPPLPISNVAQCHPSISATLRSLKKEADNSSAQTYSAVYSCDLAANLDIDQDIFQQHRSSIRRRSILKTIQSVSAQSQILFLYMKNLIDSYALQPNHHQPILLATSDENRIQLYNARVSPLFSLFTVRLI